MANRTYLFRADLCPCSIDGAPKGQVLCAASYSIPVFWLMLFDISSIVETQAMEEGRVEPNRYPCMVALAQEAIRLAQSRWPAVQIAIGPAYEPLFRMFCEFIRTTPGKFIQCETQELWWLMEPDTEGFLSGLQGSLSTFGTAVYEATRTPGLPRRLSKPWIELLNGSRVSVRHGIMPPGVVRNPESLCGYACIRDVPWQSG
jgi:hypothetical protein